MEPCLQNYKLLHKNSQLFHDPAPLFDIKYYYPYWFRLFILALLTLILSLSLAWVSTGFQSLEGWGSFLAVLLIGAGMLWLAWRLLQSEKLPAWLGGLAVAAALLRLALGVAWSVALPIGGYNSEAEIGGYVMADAHERDQAAWELARSDKPLLRSFQGYRKADQYGGLLFSAQLLTAPWAVHPTSRCCLS
jgi:hypothetical protein